MDFFVRVFPEALLAARQRLADFLGAQAEDLVFDHCGQRQVIK